VPGQDDQRLGVGHRQRAKQDRIHEAVDCGVGSDPEGERQNCESAKGLVGGQRAQGVANVGSEGIEPGDDPDFPRVFAGERRVAELPPRARGGGFAGKALPGLLELEHFAVEVHLFAELSVEAVAPEEKAQLVAETCPHGQTPSMTAAIAPVMRSKPWASRARRFRPAGVIR